jgi:hypothetical protein
MKKLKASVGGYMGVSYKVEIDFQNFLAEYTTFNRGYEFKSSKKINLSKEKIATFLKAIDTLKITEWKKYYKNPDIRDGTNWSLEICFDDNKEYRFTGNNVLPKQWKTFCRSIQELLLEVFM